LNIPNRFFAENATMALVWVCLLLLWMCRYSSFAEVAGKINCL